MNVAGCVVCQLLLLFISACDKKNPVPADSGILGRSLLFFLNVSFAEIFHWIAKGERGGVKVNHQHFPLCSGGHWGDGRKKRATTALLTGVSDFPPLVAGLRRVKLVSLWQAFADHVFPTALSRTAVDESTRENAAGRYYSDHNPLLLSLQTAQNKYCLLFPQRDPPHFYTDLLSNTIAYPFCTAQKLESTIR